MTHNSDITGTTPVFNWMIRLSVWAIGGLGSGCALTVGALVWWAVGVESRVSQLEVKRDDVVSMLGSINRKLDGIEADLNAMHRQVDVMESRMKP